MKVPPPEKRKCDECTNSMTLNLFRLNSSICRYCQDGITVPHRLLEMIEEKEQDTEVDDKERINTQAIISTNDYLPKDDDNEAT